MTFLRKLFGRAPQQGLKLAEVLPSHSAAYANGAELGDYYSVICESRPYVVAMREVAADAHRSC